MINRHESLISSLEDMSTGLLSRIDRSSFEELVMFADNRQDLIDQLESEITKTALNDSQKARLRALVESDHIIRRKMEFYRNEAAEWLKQKEKIKVQRNAYESITNYADSILMDQKK